MKTLERAARLINGTFGELTIDGERIAECIAVQLKISKSKEDVNLCGQIMTDAKMMSAKGTGSLTIYHVDSGFLLREEDLQNGVDRRFVLVTSLRDPDAYGHESIAVYNLSFDDLTLADWAAAKNGQVTMPFTFTRYQLLDKIMPE